MSARDYTDGLRELADFLDRHPELIPEHGAMITLHVGKASDEEERAEVDRLAAILDATPRWTSDGRTHYEAKRMFGPHEFGVLAITRAEMRRYNAHMDKYREGEGEDRA